MQTKRRTVVGAEKRQKVPVDKGHATSPCVRGPKSLISALDVWTLAARAEGKSQGTVALVDKAVGLLVEFLESAGMSTDVNSVAAAEIREFIASLQNRNAFLNHRFARPQSRKLSPVTVSCYLRSLRACWTWLVAEKIAAESPFARVKVPRAPRRVVGSFSEDQIRRLLAAVDTSTPVGYRDWVIYLTLLDTGLRVAELCGLPLEHADLEEKRLRVFGKGARERFVPIGAKVEQALREYRDHYRPGLANPKQNRFFLTEAGRPLTRNRVEDRLKWHGKMAGVTGIRCSPHTFRHTFAITYLKNGGDPFTLQQILGHSDLDMVNYYLDIAFTDVQEAHRKFSPVDNFDLRTTSASRRGGRVTSNRVASGRPGCPLPVSADNRARHPVRAHRPAQWRRKPAPVPSLDRRPD